MRVCLTLALLFLAIGSTQSALAADRAAAPTAPTAKPTADTKSAVPTKPWGRLETAEGKVFELTKPTVVVGTATDCDVVLTEGSIAPHHFKLSFVGGNAVVEELGSQFGTLVAGSELKLGKPRTIANRVQIDPGSIMLQFTFLDRGAVIQPTQKEVIRKNMNEPPAKGTKASSKPKPPRKSSK